MQRLADYHFQQRQHQSKSPIRQHQRAAPHAHTQMQKSILFLLREIVTAQRLRIASTTIQRQFRLYMERRRRASVLIIQLWFHTYKAIARVKLKKALRFLRRLAQRKLLRLFTMWRTEVKLIVFKKKNLGPKKVYYWQWRNYVDEILTFKNKMKLRWIQQLCQPMMLGWREYTLKCIRVRRFVLKMIMSEKKRCLDDMKFLVIATKRSTQIDNWVRCMNARLLLRKLKINALAKKITDNVICVGGILVTTELKRRGAIAVQKIYRAYDGRFYAKEYREEVTKNFLKDDKGWVRSMLKSGQMGARETLHIMNENVLFRDGRTSVKTSKSPRRSPQGNGDGKSKGKGGGEGEDKGGERKQQNFARDRFAELDVHNVGHIPLTAAAALFDRSGLHLSTTEKEMTGSMIADQNNRIQVQAFAAFMNSGVVYESSTTPIEAHVSKFGAAVRGTQLHAIRMLRSVTGESKKRREERMTLKQGQICSQLDAWKKHDLNQIYCLQCRTHFCFASELVLDHLKVAPSYLRDQEFNPNKIMKTFKFCCPLVPEMNEMTRERRLSCEFGNEIVFEEVHKFGMEHSHAHGRLNVGGLLG